MITLLFCRIIVPTVEADVTHGVHVRFQGHPLPALSHLPGQRPMIAIPSINASDGLDPFDRMQPPIQGFFQNKSVDHACTSPRVIMVKNDAPSQRTCLFYGDHQPHTT